MRLVAPAASLSAPERYAEATVRLQHTQATLGVSGPAPRLTFEEAARRLTTLKHDLDAQASRHDD